MAMEDHAILITGANRGLGLELARQYSQSGWGVIACCRMPEKAVELSRLAANTGGRLQVMPLDVARPESIERLGESLKGMPLDILFSNAGTYGPTSQGQISTIQGDYPLWHEVFSVNTMAPVYLLAALKTNLLMGRKKTIALMSSKMGSITDNTSGGAYIYRSSKAALNAVGKSLALDLAAEEIKLVMLHPGWVQTDMGGPNALITAEESVAGICQILEHLTLAQSGSFFNYDGAVLPW
jgi:NAD(P)-dependent dehydrogenase (short-subunit alcohol dehydrogenase family)